MGAEDPKAEIKAQEYTVLYSIQVQGFKVTCCFPLSFLPQRGEKEGGNDGKLRGGVFLFFPPQFPAVAEALPSMASVGH